MKNKTSYSLLIGLLFTSFFVSAQNFTIGVKAGLSIPNLTAGSGNQNPLNTGYSSRLGFDGSIFAELKITDNFSIQPIIEYSSQGGKKDGLQAFPTPSQFSQMYPPGEAPTYLYANYNSEAKLNYLMVPILAKFGWNIGQSPVGFYVGAGPFVSFLVSAHQVTSGESTIYYDPAGTQPVPGGSQPFNNTTDIKNSLHNLNTGFEANLGFNYKIGSDKIFIEGGGNYGFLNIQKYSADGKNNTGAATITIGYSHGFGK